MGTEAATFYGPKPVIVGDRIPDDPDTYVHPQETWSESECRTHAKSRERDGYGTLHLWPGKISGSSSVYPSYGYTTNMGASVDGRYYRRQHKPLPRIPATYEFVQRATWGIYIRKKKNHE